MNLLSHIFQTKDKYEKKFFLENYIRAHFGLFLVNQPLYDKSEIFYHTLLGEALPYIDTTTRALDAGCALGRLVFEYEKMGAVYSCGIDTSQQFITCANGIKSNNEKSIHYPISHSTSEFFCGDFLEYSFQQKHFSFISCINVVDRVVNPFTLIDKIYTLLEDNGILMLCTPYDWEFSPAPAEYHVQDMKLLLQEKLWHVEKELHNVPYTIPIDKNHDREYLCHVILVRKNTQ